MTNYYKRLFFIMLLLGSLVMSLTSCSSNTMPELRKPLQTSEVGSTPEGSQPSHDSSVETEENLSDLVKQDNPLEYNYTMHYQMESPNDGQSDSFVYTGDPMELTVALEVSGFRSVGIMILIDGVVQPINYLGRAEHVQQFKSFGLDNPYMIECYFQGNERNLVLERIPLEVLVTSGRSGQEYPLTLLVFNEPSRKRHEVMIPSGVHGCTASIYFEADSQDISSKIDIIDRSLKSLDAQKIPWTHDEYASFLDEDGVSQIDHMVVQWLRFDKEDFEALFEESLGKEKLLKYGIIREDGSFDEDLASKMGLPLINTQRHPNLDIFFHFAGPADHRLKQLIFLDYYPLQMGQGDEYVCGKEDYVQVKAQFDFSNVDREMTLFSIVVDSDSMDFYGQEALNLIPGEEGEN